MTVDREVVRETEEAKTKKRFTLFSGRGKETTKPRISRPPGPESLAAPQTSSSSSSKDDDDELPARVSLDKQGKPETKVDPMPAPSPAKGKEEQPKLPSRAGFDLKAISEAVALAKATGDGNELRSAVPPPVPSYVPAHNVPMLDRTTKSEELKIPSSPTTPTAPYQKSFSSGSETSLNRTTVVDKGPSRRLETTQTADLSKEDDRMTPPSGQAGVSPYGSFQQYAPRRESLASALAPTHDTASWSSPFDTPTPTLSFGGADGSIWTPHTGSTGRFGNGLETPMTTGSGFGFGQTLDEGFYKGPSYNLSQKPTGARYDFGDTSRGLKSDLGSNPLAGSSTISFGADDGTISVGPSTLEKDVWAPKPIMGGSKKPLYAVNPWES